MVRRQAQTLGDVSFFQARPGSWLPAGQDALREVLTGTCSPAWAPWQVLVKPEAVRYREYGRFNPGGPDIETDRGKSMRDIPHFIAGFKQFKKQYFCPENAFYDALAQGQRPKVLTVACCDSRVDPAILMNCQPGDMFVVRNVANIVPPYEAGAGLRGACAALEYGVVYLGVEHVIVLGHSCCGGIEALMAPDLEKMGEFIGPWVNIVQSALQRVEEEFAGEPVAVRQKACELASILVSLENLLTFPWIRTRVENQTLHLHGWYFDMGKGELLGYQPELGSFELLVER